MPEYLIKEETLTNIAESIRSKTGTTAKINPNDMDTTVSNIVTLSEGTADATAVAADLLTGKTAYVNGNKITGSIPNNGAVSQAINAGGSYIIPAGYHNGSGKVTGNSLASQTSATAAAADIASGKTAWVNGSQVTGSLVKGNKVKTGYVNGPNSYSLTISGLDFKPVGIMVVPYDTDNETTVTHVGVIAGFYDGSKAYTVKAYSTQTYLTLSHSDASCTIGSNSITLKDRKNKWEDRSKFFYVVWGE